MSGIHKSNLSGRFFLSIGIVGLCSIMPLFSQTVTYYETGEIFAGPFPSWKNIQTDFGAKGDGKTNDAPALQAALNAMREVGKNSWSILYFPAGTYKIDSTLFTKRIDTNSDYNGFGIIGENPSTTVISWNGKVDGTMFDIDGWFCKINRLGFDGKGKAGIGIMRDGAFATYCELNDLFFTDMKTGISMGGPSGEGQAEHAIERCRFIRCSESGVVTKNFNVMDIYVWYCLFEDCGVGLLNEQGSFQSIENVFLRSKKSDVESKNAFMFTFLNNTSINSKTFIGPFMGNVFLQGNKIYNTQDFIAIHASVTGKPDDKDLVVTGTVTAIGNTVRSRYAKGTVIDLSSDRHFFADNTFTVANPISRGSGSNICVATKIVDPSTLAVPATVSLPATPPAKSMKVFEFIYGTGNNAKELQHKIDLASQESAHVNPVIHIAKGNFSLEKTVVFPANKQLLVIGDGAAGYGTVIGYSGRNAGPGFRLRGPSRVTMRDLNINFGGSKADAVVVEKCDQPGGRIFCDQILSPGISADDPCDISVFVDGVEQSDVTMINGGWGEFARWGVAVKGGPVLSSGGTTNGQVSLLFGALGNNPNQILNVQNGGMLLAYGFRDEMPKAGTIINLSSTSGKMTIGSMSWAGTASATIPFVNIDNFKGTFTFIGNSMGDGYGENAGSCFTRIAGDGSQCKVLSVSNDHRQHNSISAATTWRDSTSPKAQAVMINASGGPGNSTVHQIPNVINQTTGAPLDTQFVLTSLSQIRNLRVEPPVARQQEVTDVKLFRVFINAAKGKVGLVLRAK